MEEFNLEVVVSGIVRVLSGMRFSSDFINDFECENEDGIDIMSKDNFDWWIDYINRFNKAEDLIINNLENGKYNEDYHNYINGVEFNDLPEAMENYYKENC